MEDNKLMENVQQENRKLWIDNLRVIATVSVILLHVSSNLIPRYGNISPFFWWVGNVYDSSVRFCVPIFVMITGALLLSKNYEIGDFLKSRLFRIIIPLTF